MINQEQTIRELFDVNSKLPVYSKPTSFVVADKKSGTGFTNLTLFQKSILTIVLTQTT